MRLAIGLFAATTLLLTACDNLKFKVVTDSEIEKQMDLLTQHGPWLCEGKVGEGDSAMDFRSAQIWTKTGVDEATTYMQASFENEAFTMITSEVDMMKIEKAGLVTQYPQVFEFRGIELSEKAEARLPFISRDKRKGLDEFLTTTRNDFALDSRAEFENPTTWSFDELTETSLIVSNESGTITCKHGEVSTLFNDYGLVAK